MDQIELVEETDLFLSKDQLTHEQALALHRDQHFEIDWPNPANDFRFRLRSKGRVGHIPVGQTMLIVQPKVPISSIFAMLEVAYRLKSFNILEGEAAVQSLEEVYERIASILAKRVNDRVRKGLYRGYLERDDDLEYVRGRVDIRGNIRNAAIGAPRLRCHYEELTADLEENAILLWAVYVTSRLGLRRDDVRRDVRRAYRSLVAVVSLEPKNVRDCIGRFYHRLNDDYQPMHALCRFLIEHAGPGTKIGRHESFPFSVDMPKLFEMFVAELLKEHLPKNLRVDVQHHARLDANAELSFQIDLVLRDRITGTCLAVFDTKYKSSGQPLESDIQQVVAYAVQLGVTKAHLLYPFAVSKPVRAKIGNIEVTTIGIDLSRPSADFARALIDKIAA